MKTLREFMNEVEIKKLKVFHGTTKDKISSIQKYGLVPESDGLWLTINKKFAQDFANEKGKKKKKEPIVLELIIFPEDLKGTRFFDLKKSVETKSEYWSLEIPKLAKEFSIYKTIPGKRIKIL